MVNIIFVASELAVYAYYVRPFFQVDRLVDIRLVPWLLLQCLEDYILVKTQTVDILAIGEGYCVYLTLNLLCPIDFALVTKEWRLNYISSVVELHSDRR